MPEPVPISIFHRSEFYTCRFVIMSAENVQLAIRRNIELAFVKKAKIEFKGDRAEARILVSTCCPTMLCLKFSTFVFVVREIDLRVA